MQKHRPSSNFLVLPPVKLSPYFSVKLRDNAVVGGKLFWFILFSAHNASKKKKKTKTKEQFVKGLSHAMEASMWKPTI